MASNDDEGCSNAKKLKIDASTEDETVQSLNAQFPKIDNLEYFPEKVLFHIFSKVNDNDLLHLSDTSCRFEKIARVVFKDKYADEYFVIDGYNNPGMYKELFNRFGRSADIKAIKVWGIKDITENHWLTQLLRQYTNHLQKLTFHNSSFNDIRNILSEHMSVEHLALSFVETNVEFNLTEYRNLKKLELIFARRYNFINLTQVIQNNPALESLKLCSSLDSFTFHDAMLMIAKNSMYLKQLTELDLEGFQMKDRRISDDDMDSIIDALKNLQSLMLKITNNHLELIQRLSLACKRLKQLTLGPHKWYKHFSDAMIDALGQFTTIEKFELHQDQYNDRIESVIGNMSNLRHLDLWMYVPDSNKFILSLLRNCPSIETLTLHSFPGIKPKTFVNAQFWDEFNEVMQQPNGKVELTWTSNFTCYITKKEIVWENVVMHWHEWNCNETNLTLLDLATPSVASVGAEAELKPSPFDHILDYLDLTSLHSMSTVCKQSKHLVENYVKRHAQQNGTFTISDQFHQDAEGLDAFAEHVENLKVEILDTDFIDHLNTITKSFTNITKLSIRSRLSSQSHCIFPQVRHLTVDMYSPHLCSILQFYPKLETINFKYKFSLSECCLKSLTNCNLKKFTFKYFNESQLEETRKIFEKTSIEFIPIPMT